MIELQCPRDRNGKPQLRSLADTLDLLRHYKISETARIEFRAMPLCLPDRSVTTFLALVATEPEQPELYLHLPPTSRFTAISSDGERSLCASHLRAATVGRDGKVTLADGSSVLVTEFKYSRLPSAFDEVQWQILHIALKVSEHGREAYRLAHRPGQPGVRYLDFSRLSRVNVAKLKKIEHAVSRAGIEVSRQKIAEVLKRAGLRIPASSKRAA